MCVKETHIVRFFVRQAGFEPASLPHGTCFTDKRAHQLLN